jgi:feruloyl esterase
MFKLRLVVPLAMLLGLAVLQPALAQESCEALTSLRLPSTTVTRAVLRPETTYSGIAPLGLATGARMPARCEVTGVIAPTPDSEIKFAVWPPVTGWNGKYRQEGNSGWAGVIPYWNMIDPLRRGYATAATDNGHEASPGAVSGAFAIGDPEKLIDFGHRAVHETSVQAKALIRAFYGRAPERSYFVGCSEGGREALMSAQRHPDDFHGMIAAAPSADYSGVMTAFAWNQRALSKTGSSYVPPMKLPLIQRAVHAACDELDGLKDGLLEEPRACRFDPSVLTCKGASTDDCLTNAQVDALRQLYAGPTNPRTGQRLFAGVPPGHEGTPRTWTGWMITEPPTNAMQLAHATAFYGEVVFERPGWDLTSLDFDRDVAFAKQKVGPILDATNADLRAFRASGGKLLQYHGWGDAAVSPLASVEYYESVKALMDTDDFYRLFMVPGMGHCGGVGGAAYFGNVGLGDPVDGRDPERDVFSALERWVERGVAPNHLIGAGTVAPGANTRLTRPICAYPAVARYKGSGDVNDAANFACGPPLQGVRIGAASVTGVPFANGQFEGTGHWINQQAEGDYTVTYTITDIGDGGKRHGVRRLFLKPDGSPASEEYTTVLFTPTTRNRMRVSLASANGTVEGLGYCLGDQCHYQAMISSGEQMEVTFTVAGSRVDALASSTNKGNFTTWAETLHTR